MLAVEEKQQIQLTSILMMAIMLTAGKLALLYSEKRKKQKKYVDICHEKIEKEMKVFGAYEGLSRGYQIKVKLFQKAPALYLWLYHFRKYKKNFNPPPSTIRTSKNFKYCTRIIRNSRNSGK